MIYQAKRCCCCDTLWSQHSFQTCSHLEEIVLKMAVIEFNLSGQRTRDDSKEMLTISNYALVDEVKLIPFWIAIVDMALLSLYSLDELIALLQAMRQLMQLSFSFGGRSSESVARALIHCRLLYYESCLYSSTNFLTSASDGTSIETRIGFNQWPIYKAYEQQSRRSMT